MALVKESKVLGINDAKISKLTADTAAALTYDAAIDVPGIQEIGLTPSFVEKELRGDEKIIDQYLKLDRIAWTLNHAKLSLDVAEVILGGTYSETGITPNVVGELAVLGADRPNYFKIEGQSTYGDNGDAHVILYKCKANKFDIVFQGEEYLIVNAGGFAIPATNDDSFFDIVFNETAVAIS